MNRIRFIKVRSVKSPSRSYGSAGIDFYVPYTLSLDDISYHGQVEIITDPYGLMDSIKLYPNSRVLIPSGIRVLIEPKQSALIASNKSGISTRKGLVFTAQVVDSDYTGEIHIGIANIGHLAQEIHSGEKIIQFIHTPILLSPLEEISGDEYLQEESSWGSRGSNGFGSTDNK